jgi:hypothetical protein
MEHRPTRRGVDARSRRWKQVLPGEDLGSKHGTFVGGEPIESGRRLLDGDLVEIGHSIFVYRHVEPSVAARSLVQLTAQDGKIPLTLLAKKTLEDVGKLGADATEGQKVRARLLVWVAEKRRGNGTYIGSAVESVVESYRAMPDGLSVYQRENPDGLVRGLLCLPSEEECRVYDLLAVPKDAESPKSLREALRGRCCRGECEQGWLRS